MDLSDADLVELALAVMPRRSGCSSSVTGRRRGAGRCGCAVIGDIVQESFLQAFAALGRLQDPDRFAGWLAGIVLNVHRASKRRARCCCWPTGRRAGRAMRSCSARRGSTR